MVVYSQVYTFAQQFVSKFGIIDRIFYRFSCIYKRAHVNATTQVSQNLSSKIDIFLNILYYHISKT